MSTEPLQQNASQQPEQTTSLQSTDVLIVGAGPTGLMLGLWLARLGVRFRIIDQKPGITRESRALAVQARTLETYDMLGLGPQALSQGRQAKAINLWSERKHIGRVGFEAIGKGLSPHPYIFILGQDKNERLLLDALEACGQQVEWNTRLQGLEQDSDYVRLQLEQPAGHSQSLQARYVCGCDGASSSLRHLLGIGFPGGTYSNRFYVADTRISGAIKEGELNLCFNRNRFQAFFPMPGPGRFRIVGIVPPRLQEQPELHFKDIEGDIENNFEVKIQECSWFSSYRVHHRVAEQFQSGRAFLLGDAGHIHSPAGGQGMNTGLMDASNLGWKLAAVIKGQCEPRLLESYAAERMPFARALVGMTDRAFGLATNPKSNWLRTWLIPQLFKLGSRSYSLRRQLFATLSQTRIRYRSSPLAQNAEQLRPLHSLLHSGDRLPWVASGDGSNFEALKSLRPQIHVYGKLTEEIEAFAKAHPAWPLERFEYSPEARKKGLLEGAFYFVRPDGYLAYLSEHFDPEAFRNYLKESWGWRLPL